MLFTLMPLRFRLLRLPLLMIDTLYDAAVTYAMLTSLRYAIRMLTPRHAVTFI